MSTSATSNKIVSAVFRFFPENNLEIEAWVETSEGDYMMAYARASGDDTWRLARISCSGGLEWECNGFAVQPPPSSIIPDDLKKALRLATKSVLVMAGGTL